jgi:hypothetical protein
MDEACESRINLFSSDAQKTCTMRWFYGKTRKGRLREMPALDRMPQAGEGQILGGKPLAGMVAWLPASHTAVSETIATWQCPITNVDSGRDRMGDFAPLGEESHRNARQKPWQIKCQSIARRLFQRHQVGTQMLMSVPKVIGQHPHL